MSGETPRISGEETSLGETRSDSPRLRNDNPHDPAARLRAMLEGGDPHMDGSWTVALPKYTDRPGKVWATLPHPFLDALHELLDAHVAAGGVGEALPDTPPCQWCSHSKADHRRENGGCDMWCPCSKYEAPGEVFATRRSGVAPQPPDAAPLTCPMCKGDPILGHWFEHPMKGQSAPIPDTTSCTTCGAMLAIHYCPACNGEPLVLSDVLESWAKYAAAPSPSGELSELLAAWRKRAARYAASLDYETRLCAEVATRHADELESLLGRASPLPDTAAPGDATLLRDIRRALDGYNTDDRSDGGLQELRRQAPSLLTRAVRVFEAMASGGYSEISRRAAGGAGDRFAGEPAEPKGPSGDGVAHGQNS